MAWEELVEWEEEEELVVSEELVASVKEEVQGSLGSQTNSCRSSNDQCCSGLLTQRNFRKKMHLPTCSNNK